jgi:hypothetical protein
MKKLLSIVMLMICFISFANAQKGKKDDVFNNPNNKAARILPDLNILLVPRLTNGGTEAVYEPVAGVSGRIKIPVNLIIKNVGFATSKPCKVVLYAHYQRNRTLSEIEHGVAEGAFNDAAVSEPMLLEALEQGKDIGRKHAFTFNRFPNLAPGKKVRLTAIIFYQPVNGELSNDNNKSREFEVSLTTEL